MASDQCMANSELSRKSPMPFEEHGNIHSGCSYTASNLTTTSLMTGNFALTKSAILSATSEASFTRIHHQRARMGIAGSQTRLIWRKAHCKIRERERATLERPHRGYGHDRELFNILVRVRMAGRSVIVLMCLSVI